VLAILSSYTFFWLFPRFDLHDGSDAAGVFPVIESLHFHPIWFGVVAVLMMEAGLITPPVGLNVYTLAGIAKDVPMAEIFKGAAPFLLAIILIVVILTLFPEIALFLPSLMGK